MSGRDPETIDEVAGLNGCLTLDGESVVVGVMTTTSAQGTCFWMEILIDVAQHVEPCRIVQNSSSQLEGWPLWGCHPTERHLRDRRGDQIPAGHPRDRVDRQCDRRSRSLPRRFRFEDIAERQKGFPGNNPPSRDRSPRERRRVEGLL